MTAPVAPARAIRNPLDPRNPLAGIYLATMLFELAEGALRFLVPLNLEDRSLGPASIGFVIFAFSVTSLLSRGLTASLFRPDRARRLIILAGAASTIAYLITPFVTDVAAFTVLMAIDGFGWGVATTSLLTMVMLCTPAAISPGVAMGCRRPDHARAPAHPARGGVGGGPRRGLSQRDEGLLQSLFPLLGLALGLSVAQIGTLSSVRSGISAVARFGAGWLFARVAPTRLHLPLLTMSAATLAVLPSAGTYLLQMPLFALNGISRGLLRVTTSAAAMEVTPGPLAGPQPR